MTKDEAVRQLEILLKDIEPLGKDVVDDAFDVLNDFAINNKEFVEALKLAIETLKKGG